jgi:hypothetical protein
MFPAGNLAEAAIVEDFLFPVAPARGRASVPSLAPQPARGRRSGWSRRADARDLSDVRGRCSAGAR